MEGIGLGTLSRLPSPMRPRFSRLWRRRRESAPPPPPPEDPLLAAGQQLRRRREQRHLSLRQLAMETRISTAVLEALERGWRDRLPEPTYLRTMLPLIERHLDLDPGSLEAVLPAEALRGPATAAHTRLRRFTPGSIDVFTSWQGTLLYAVLVLGLIYALNLQQQQLARSALRTVAPIPPAPAATPEAGPDAEPPTARGAAGGSGDSLLLGIYPDLRPLEQAAAGQGLRLWRRASSP